MPPIRPRDRFRVPTAALFWVLVGAAGCGGSESTPPVISTPSAEQVPPATGGLSLGGDTMPLKTTPATAEERAALADALASVDPDRSRYVGQPGTKLMSVPTPGLADGAALYRADVMSVSRPLAFYVGLAGGEAVVLTGDPTAFNRFAGGRATIDSEATAAGFARVRLEATRSMNRFGAVVDSVDDIRLLPTRSAEQDAVVERVRGVVKAPASSKADDGFRVVAFMTDGPQLLRHDLVVAANGHVTGSSEVVEASLPVPGSR